MLIQKIDKIDATLSTSMTKLRVETESKVSKQQVKLDSVQKDVFTTIT
jgi:hypothetical protein